MKRHTKNLDDPHGASGKSWLRPLFLTRRVQFILDLSALVAAFVLAYLLRFDFQVPEEYQDRVLLQLPLVVMVQFTVLLLSGIYTFVWRYVGLRELGAFLRAAALSALPILVLRLTLTHFPDWQVPLSVIVMDTILAFGALLGLRVLRRLLYESLERRRRSREGAGRGRPVILVGAGRAGVLAVREIQSRGDLDLDVLGFVDDDPLKRSMVIHGVRVLGSTRELPALIREHGIDHVVITIADARQEELRPLVETCERLGVPVRTIPGLFELLQGKVEISRLRDVEVEELLGRAPVDLRHTELGLFLNDRRVMVTGAGGSIGSELARQIARFRPERLLLVERSENALFEVHRELAGLWPELRIVPLVADVGDEPRMTAIFAGHRPHVVLHSAAHKHVPMMESNPSEAIKNNVLATRSLGELAGRHGADEFVLISTDKAVHPSSIMGASKRVAELAVQALDQLYPTRYVSVRFGNVLGSAGAVVPIFLDQIARGGPVTVTHPEMKRYFMTLSEAAQLVLEAGAMGEGGEIFVLDMGDPVKILDLAREMIRLSGLTVGEDIDIEFTGTRPGEKLFEELAVHGEDIAKTRHPKIFIGRLAEYPPAEVERALERLDELTRQEDEAGLRAFLVELLPEARLGEVAAERPRQPQVTSRA